MRASGLRLFVGMNAVAAAAVAVAQDARPPAPLDPSDSAEYSIVPKQPAVQGYYPDANTQSSTGSVTGYEYATKLIYTEVPVGGDRTVDRFYYIRQDHYLALVRPGTDPSIIETYRTFGPHPIGAAVATRIGFNYFFIPICGQRFASDQ